MGETTDLGLWVECDLIENLPAAKEHTLLQFAGVQSEQLTGIRQRLTIGDLPRNYINTRPYPSIPNICCGRTRHC